MFETTSEKFKNSILRRFQGVTQSAVFGQLTSSIQNDLDEFEAWVKKCEPSRTKSGREVLSHVFSQPGKRLRPSLFFLSARVHGYSGEHLYPMALVSELVHTASLLHDDVIDNSTLRRNKPTPASIWGDETAILVGDLIYSYSSEIMAKTQKISIVESFARAIRLMSEGELLQLDHLYDFNVSEDVYFQIVVNKTAELMATICRTSALLAEASKQQEQAMYDFGLNLGIAFQLIDDCLDWFSESIQTVGKPICSDVFEGKFTLAFIFLRDLMSDSEKLLLKSRITDLDKDFYSDVKPLLEKYCVQERVLSEARKYTSRCMEALNVFPESDQLDSLRAVAEFLLKRVA